MNRPPHHRILVIDDNRRIHEDFRKILCPPDADDAIDRLEAEFFGEHAKKLPEPIFFVDSAFQGEEGITKVQGALDCDQPYAVAFVDVRMPPGIDGIETAERLWRIDNAVQIVICTAHSDYSWQEMMRRFRLPDRLLVLKKPFTAVEALQMASALGAKWLLERQARAHLGETERIVAERTRELREAAGRLKAEVNQHEQTQRHLLRAQRLECIGTLAGGIAHDLNNLISPITLSAQMLHNPLSEAARHEMVCIVENCAERAAGIIRQVLTFARGIEGERIALQLRHLIREVEDIASETFPRLIKIRTCAPAHVRLVEGDATQLQQVLMNLCVNARDAMPEGGTLTITADNFDVDDSYSSMTPDARPGPHVRLQVADTGVGIPSGQLEKIFDPFFTTKPIGKGSGLGLSSVAGIVKSHGGFVEVRSEVGKGTTFDVFLPASVSNAEAIKGEETVTSLPVGHGELILVVDDESDIRHITHAALTQHGYRTLLAEDGAEAISIYAQQSDKIDAVLTDLLMPTVDGITLCRAMRNIDPKGSIIVSTGEGGEEKLAELQELNVSSVLNKPFTVSMLLNALQKALSPVCV